MLKKPLYYVVISNTFITGHKTLAEAKEDRDNHLEGINTKNTPIIKGYIVK